MQHVIDAILRLSIPALVLLYLLIAPYTKVEESFNIQAIHDIITYGIPAPGQQAAEFLTDHYDHVAFPGSVPRTFVGAVILSGLTRPFVTFLKSPYQLQILVRAILGLLNAYSLIRFHHAVYAAFGRSAGRWYLAFQATQFHVIYYASRTLPNMLAFAISEYEIRVSRLVIFVWLTCNEATEATRNIMLSLSSPRNTITRRRLALYMLTLAGVIFRSEIAILLTTYTAYLFLRHKPGTRQAFVTNTVTPAGSIGLLTGLLATMSIDTFFWQTAHPLWPELRGFMYNTIGGHASEWGTSPFQYYFTNAIPRLLLNPMTYLVCIPISLWSIATRSVALDVLTPVLAYVAIYSFLPHKEWRFIIYTIPSLTAVAASGAAWIWTRRTKSAIYSVLSLCLLGSVIASLLASGALLYISSLNYPGAQALTHLHDLVHTNAIPAPVDVKVYLDDLACQTGVTRFLQLDQTQHKDVGGTIAGHEWAYDKTGNETLLLNPLFWGLFDFAIVENKDRAIGSWIIVDRVQGYAGIDLRGSVEAGDGTVPKHDGMVKQGLDMYERGSALVQRHITRGYWPRIRMEDRLFIMRRGNLP